MATQARTKAPPPTLLSIALVVAGLYFARDVLIPIALSVLLSFLLAPAVGRLQRAGMRRSIAVAIVIILAFVALGGLGWYIGEQTVELAKKMPRYRENIHNKIDSLHFHQGGAFSRLSDAFESVSQEVQHATVTTAPSTEPTAAKQDSGDSAPPVQSVRIVEDAPSGLGVLRATLSHIVGPLENALIVAVLTIFILLELEDIRDRVLHLLGGERLTVTAQAMEDAAQRVGHYLLMQSAVNGAVGLTIGIGLTILHVPNAFMWGFLALVLRFIPYIGIWLAAAAPVVLAVAVFPGWLHAGLTVGLFLTVELCVSNFLEPLIYGSGTGVSTVAILIAAIFWAWLWGGVGLLLATPLTVCLVVMGQYVPRLRFLSVALSDRPAMSPATRIYHRLLAMDTLAARETAREYLKEKSETQLFDDVLIPSLIMAEHDRHNGDLLPDREKFIYDQAAALIEAPLRKEGEQAAGVSVVCIPARDRADEIAAAMLCRLLAAENISAVKLSAQQLASEVVTKIESYKPRAVVISGVPPGATGQAVYLCKRLRSRVPDVKVLVGLWRVRRSAKVHADHFQAEFEAHTATTLAEAVQQLRIMVRRPVLPAATAEAIVNELSKPLLAMDKPGADAVLDRAAETYSPEDIAAEVLQRAMLLVEGASLSGAVTSEQERFATGLIRNRLLALNTLVPAPTDSKPERRAVVACPPDEEHDPRLLIVGLLLKAHGWGIEYFGQPSFHPQDSSKPADPHAPVKSPGNEPHAPETSAAGGAQKLSDLIDSVKPCAILFSAMFPKDVRWFSRIAGEIAVPGKPPVLVAGGAAFNSDPFLAAQFAVVVRGDPRAAMDEIEAAIAGA